MFPSPVAPRGSCDMYLGGLRRSQPCPGSAMSIYQTAPDSGPRSSTPRHFDPDLQYSGKANHYRLRLSPAECSWQWDSFRNPLLRYEVIYLHPALGSKRGPKRLNSTVDWSGHLHRGWRVISEILFSLCRLNQPLRAKSSEYVSPFKLMWFTIDMANRVLAPAFDAKSWLRCDESTWHTLSLASLNRKY